uniref:Retrotransposon protein, putative, unclassified n=1 Tax=Tanacetum cinerariifolium TaxID=118510 RepID=A0A6L2L1X9_TANCI|nr:retrotransposon protein, putative, unclassified [Tanacetum cinerariifolium]
MAVTDDNTPPPTANNEKAFGVTNNKTHVPLIYGTISTSLLQTVLKKNVTAKDVWKSHKELFHDNKDARAMELQEELRSLELGNLTISEYFKKIKMVSDLLSNIESPVNENSLVMDARSQTCHNDTSSSSTFLMDTSPNPSKAHIAAAHQAQPAMSLVSFGYQLSTPRPGTTQQSQPTPQAYSPSGILGLHPSTVASILNTTTRGRWVFEPYGYQPSYLPQAFNTVSLQDPDPDSGCKFSMMNLGSLNYFLGISAIRTTSRLTLSQSKYASELIKRACMLNYNPCKTPFDSEKKLGHEGTPVSDPTLYRSLVGALQYLTFTRTGLSYDVQQLYLYMHDPQEPHLNALKRVLRYAHVASRRQCDAYLWKSNAFERHAATFLDSQAYDKFKTGVGYDSQVFDSKVNDKYKTGQGYHAVPPPYTGNSMPPKLDLILADMDEYVVSESVTSVPVVVTNKAKTSESKPKSVSEPIIEDWVSDSEVETETKSIQRKPSFDKVEFVKPNEQVKSLRESVKHEEHNRQAKHPKK